MKRSHAATQRPPKSRPRINSSAYVFDRVQRIEVLNEVSAPFDDRKSLENCHAQARDEAFRQLLEKLGTSQAFTAECIPLERRVTQDDGCTQLLVGCELRYTTGQW